MRHLEKIGSVTISSGQTVSSILASRLGFGSASDITIHSPSTLTGTCTVKVAGANSETTAANFKTLSVNGTDVTCIAGKAVEVPAAAFGALLISSGSAEGADRVFDVYGQMDV